MQPPIHNTTEKVSHDDYPSASAYASPTVVSTAPSSPPFATTPASPRPALWSSNSDPDTSLATPFDQLSLYDQRRQLQGGQMSYSGDRAPTDPSAGFEQGHEFGYTNERSMFHQRHVQDEKRKGVDAAVRPHPPSSPTGSNSQRPQLSHRSSSFSKRHASFDSPREVPLPFMPHSHSHLHRISHSQPQQHDVPHYSRVIGDGMDVPAEAPPPLFMSYDSVVAAPLSLEDHKAPMPPLSDAALSSTSSSSSSSSSSASQSCMDTPMDISGGAPATSAHNSYFTGTMPSPSSPSTSSFLQQPPTPVKTLQASPVSPFSRPFSSPDSLGSLSQPPRIHSPRPVHAAGAPVRSSTASLPLPAHTPYHTLPGMHGPAASGSVLRPPMLEPHSSSSNSSISDPTPSSSASAPSMSRFGLVARSDPYDRPSSPSLDHLLRRAYSGSVSPAYWDRDSLESGHEVRESLPPPALPQVLTPPPPPLSEEAERAGWQRRPYEPFLAHSPPPNDAYIAVETVSREYRLLVRLPGFRRDAITLSTRKRRILHVVADSWEPDGGHFERRISFGYDADLAQVRAEFDGEFLRVIVPRRQVAPAFWNG